MKQSIQSLHKTHKISLFQHLISPYVLPYFLIFIFLSIHKVSHNVIYDFLQNLEFTLASGTVSNSLNITDDSTSSFDRSFKITITDQLSDYQNSLNNHIQIVKENNIQVIRNYKLIFETFQSIHNSQLSSIKNNTNASLQDLNTSIKSSLNSDTAELKTLNDTVSSSVVTVGDQLDLSGFNNVIDDFNSIQGRFQPALDNLTWRFESNLWNISLDPFQDTIAEIGNLSNITLSDSGNQVTYGFSTTFAINFLNDSTSDTKAANNTSFLPLPSSINTKFTSRFKQVIKIISILFPVFFIVSFLVKHYKFKITKPFLVDDVFEDSKSDSNVQFLVRDRAVSEVVKTYLEWFIGEVSNYGILLTYLLVTITVGVCLHSFKLESNSSNEQRSYAEDYSMSKASRYELKFNQSISITDPFMSNDLNFKVQNQIDRFNLKQIEIFQNLTSFINESSDSFDFEFIQFNITFPEFQPHYVNDAQNTGGSLKVVDVCESKLSGGHFSDKFTDRVTALLDKVDNDNLVLMKGGIGGIVILSVFTTLVGVLAISLGLI